MDCTIKVYNINLGLIYKNKWPNMRHILKKKGNGLVKLASLAFCFQALKKRSGIDRGLSVLINLTSIYKDIGWITRDASLPKLTNSPDQRIVHTVKGYHRPSQVQTRTDWRLSGAELNVLLDCHLEECCGISDSKSNDLFPNCFFHGECFQSRGQGEAKCFSPKVNVFKWLLHHMETV